jgi:hypothetical protein
VIYLCPSDSVITSASLTNQAPSDVIELRERTGTGTGVVAVSGGYTGAADTVIDVEVVDSAGTSRPHTEPVIDGVGNGTLVVAIAGSVSAQDFTLTLRDAGAPEQFAKVDAFGVTIRAAAAGAGGNGITLSIAHAWTDTATEYSVPEDLPAGSAIIGTGAAYNFGAPDLLADGTIPTSAPILRFGDDAHLCRPYRQFAAGQYTYSVSPTLPRTIPAGVPVWSVSGGVTATLVQGATTETYGPHATIFALLNAIRQGSALAVIEGVVADDRRPGGMGVAPVNIRTGGHLQSSVRQGSQYIRDAAIVTSVATTAATETVTAECVELRTGAELWRLRGAISGVIGEVRSGVAFVGGPLESFTIPQQLPAITQGVRGDITYSWNPSGPDSPSCMLLWRPIVGRNAVSKSLTFTYTERQTDDCKCEDQIIDGVPNPACLGVSGLDDGGAEMDALGGIIEIKRREVDAYIADLIMTPNVGKVQTKALYDVIDTVFENKQYSSIDPGDGSTVVEDQLYLIGQPQVMEGAVGTNPAYSANSWLVSVLDAIRARIINALTASLDATTFPPQWEASTAYGFGQLIRPTNDTYIRWFQSGGYGTSGASAPSWNNTLAGTTSDNGITWTAYASRYQEWLDAWDAFQTRITDETDGLPDDWLRPDINGASADVVARRFTEDFNLALGKSDASDPEAGTDCWRDTGARFWWVNTDGPYLPAFTNTYYHSVAREYDEQGNEAIRETREFGFAIQTCPLKLRPGDSITVNIRSDGVQQTTYQIGDSVALQLVRGESLVTAGGRNATVTQVWSVRGSVVGGLPDYTITDPAAPSTYVQSGVTLTLTQGALPWRLGDAITFSAEGARVRWRRDGGSWSGSIDIGPIDIGDGMTLTFTGGKAPSWVGGDRWTIDALAVHGGTRLLSPRADGLAKWTADSDITAATSGAVRVGALLGTEGITAAQLVGSNDAFATEVTRVAMTEAADGWCAILPAAVTATQWRVEATGAGSAQWLYLGPGRQLALSQRTALAELGRADIRETITPRGVRRSASVAHTACDHASYRALLTALGIARASHDGILGAVEDRDASSASRYRAPSELSATDVHGMQPDPGRRVVSVDVELGSV